MTDHTADHFPPEPAMIDDMTAEQLASEPALPMLHALRLTASDHDALAQRIEAAAAAELARRRGPPLVVTRLHRLPAGRDLAPVIARALRPALLAAAAAGLFAVGLWHQTAGSSTGSSEAAGQQLSDASAVQALSLYDPSAQWADQGRAPTVDALGRAIGLGGAP